MEMRHVEQKESKVRVRTLKLTTLLEENTEEKKQHLSWSVLENRQTQTRHEINMEQEKPGTEGTGGKETVCCCIYPRLVFSSVNADLK